MAIVLNPWVTINLYKKKWLPVITWNKKHLLKQILSMIYAPEKDFFAAATFKGLWDVSFQKE